MKIERNNIVSRTNQRKKELLPVRTKLSHKETFFRKGIRNKMRKADVFINGPVYLDLPILEISKTLTHTSFIMVIKTKIWRKIKICYMDTDCFMAQTRTEDIYLHIGR